MSFSSEYFSNVIGNEELKKRLAKDVREGSLSHAYILEGPRGSGRHTMAYSLAAAIECEAKASEGAVDLFGEISAGSVPCGKCKSCEKILAGKSPDIITFGIEDDRSTIGVDTVRDIKNDMFTAPNDLSIKVYIIEDADLMTEQAQNAFLLSLEEPPPYVLFFLICEESALLLETVRSRAPTLRTRRLKKEQIEDYLLKHDERASALKEESTERWNALLSVSSGSLGYAIELLEEKKRNQILEYRDTAKSLISLLSRSGRVGALTAINELNGKRHEVINSISFLQYALRDLLLLKHDENVPLCFFNDRDEAAELATHFTAKGLFALYNASLTAVSDLESNSNVRLTLMNMMLNAGLL